MESRALDWSHLSLAKAPGYVFGTAPRSGYKALYRGKEDTNEAGRDSPGPSYLIVDNPQFKSAPWYSFSKAERGTTSKAESAGPGLAHSLSLDMGRKGWRFGKAARELRLEGNGVSPGPIYLPPQRKSDKAAPRFTMGVRRMRPAHASLDLLSSTTSIVGPGRYAPSHSTPFPAYTIPKRLRDSFHITKTALSETYAGQMNSCGPQIISNKRTAPIFGFGTSTREQLRGLGMVRTALDQQEIKVKIEQRQ